MKNTNQFLKTILASILLSILSVTMACTKSDNSNENVLWLLLLYASRYPAPNQTYVSRAATALRTWNINLQTGVSAGERNTSTSSAMNPANWITVTNSSCNARGVPAAWQGGTCSLTNGAIGLCITRYYTTGDVGRLVDTTLVMLDSFQSDPSQSEATKQSVFTHEVGHCLGLRHAEATGAAGCGGATNYTNCIMYPSTAGADTPHADELAAIASAYHPIAAPDGNAAYKNRFSQTSATAIRQWTDPVFTVSAVIGSAMLDANAIGTQAIPEPGPRLNGQIEIRVHAYQKDGTQKMQVFTQQPLDTLVGPRPRNH